MSKWAKAQVNRLRELMAAQRRAIDEVAEELRYRCGCSKLAAYRMAYGWSQPEAAERYTKATGGFMGQPLLSRLEQFPLGRRPCSAGLPTDRVRRRVRDHAVAARRPRRARAARRPRAGGADPLQRRVRASVAARWDCRWAPG